MSLQQIPDTSGSLIPRMPRPQSSVGRLWFQGKLPTLTSRDAMRDLLDSFPSLADFPGEWNAMAFSTWAQQSLSHGGLCAAAFIMSVWNPGENRKPPRGSPHRGLRFDLHDAFGVWDPEHRAAFVAWTREPWWP